MVSSTHSCTSRPAESAGRGRAARALLLWLALCWALPALHAQEAARAVALQVERAPEGVFLSAAMQLRLPRLVEDALNKGIAMHFVTQAQVLRQRWYWSDKVQAQAVRYLRLSYQPLTRRWRLAQSSQPLTMSGLGMVLGQTYDALDDALQAMQRISRWQIAEAGAVDEDTAYLVRFEFRLDTSQLPRPLQWGTVGGANWNLHLEGSAPLPPAAPALPETAS